MAVPATPVYMPGGLAPVRNVGGDPYFITDFDECCCLGEWGDACCPQSHAGNSWIWEHCPHTLHVTIQTGDCDCAASLPLDPCPSAPDTTDCSGNYTLTIPDRAATHWAGSTEDCYCVLDCFPFFVGPCYWSLRVANACEADCVREGCVWRIPVVTDVCPIGIFPLFGGSCDNCDATVTITV